MMHHASIGVRNRAQAAQAIAELTGAILVRAPTPPFPHRAWFIVFGDAFGSLLEVLPATSAFHPDAPLGLSRQEARF